MRRFVKLIGIGVAIVVVAASTVFLAEHNAARPALAAASPDQTAVSSHGGAIAALGRIEPQSETINLGGATTDVLVDLAVVRGSTVARGQVIGHFRGYDEAVARAKATAQQLAEAKAQLETEMALGEARV